MTVANTKDNTMVEQAAFYTARQQIMETGFVPEIEGAKVYKAQPGWECDQLKKDPNILPVHSTLELESAVQDPNCATIFVPKQSALTMEMLDRVTARNAATKTIFWEV
ncbi:MAG: hypothetical protein ACPG80_00755 [Rickettsiales bacterium]